MPALEARISREQPSASPKRTTDQAVDQRLHQNRRRSGLSEHVAAVKVERIGNANYPSGNIYGDLRMLVIINWDGKLKELRILESSGHKVLDDAALRIVRIASPFQDFSVEMRKKYDQLEIIRTWKFSRTGASLDS